MGVDVARALKLKRGRARRAFLWFLVSRVSGLGLLGWLSRHRHNNIIHQILERRVAIVWQRCSSSWLKDYLFAGSWYLGKRVFSFVDNCRAGRSFGD